MRSDSALKISLAGAALPIIAVAGQISYQVLSANRDRKRFSPPGTLVDVGGHRLHMIVSGPTEESANDDTAPTVILENGLASTYLQWSWVVQEISQSCRVVAYDRAGTGWSDPAPEPRTPEVILGELRTALEKLNISGPYVLVGHSLGGLLAQIFVDRYSDEVAGLVLADSSHPDEIERSSKQRNGLPAVEYAILEASKTKPLQILKDNPVNPAIGDGLPKDQAEELRFHLSRSENWEGVYAEFRTWLESLNAAARDVRVPEMLPLKVLTAAKVVSRDPVHGELQVDLASLSSNSTHHILEGADHDSMLWEKGHALTVVEAISSVIESGNTGEEVPRS